MYTLNNILNYVNSGIEMATWFNGFILITISKNGILLSEVSYNTESVSGAVNISNDEYILTSLEIDKDMKKIIHKIESIFNKNIKLIYNDEELIEETNYVLSTDNISLKDNLFELSVIIIPSTYDDFWIELFFENIIKNVDEIINDIVYKFGIRELSLHKSLDDCIDHMLLFFGYR